MNSGIFAKQSELRPTQLAAVADRRFNDAQALFATGENARANGAIYLTGFVIEILLKAQLIRHYPSIAKKRPHDLSDSERHVWSLIWRSHDLSEMLDQLPTVRTALLKQGERAGRPYLDWLLGVCALWTIFARYSTLTTTMYEAGTLLGRVRDLKELLK